MTDTVATTEPTQVEAGPQQASAVLTPTEMVLGYEKDIANTLAKVEGALGQAQQQINQLQAARQALAAQRDLVADMKSKMNLK